MILSVEKTIEIETLLKKDFGFNGHALSKSHYNGDESCLTAYSEIIVNGYVILVRQFSEFFGYYVKNKLPNEKNVAKAEAMSSGAIHDYAPNMMKFNFIRFCEPRLKNSYKRLSDAIKQVTKIKNIGWNSSDFIIVNSNGNSVIGFDTESFRNSLDFKNEIVLWQSK